MTNSANIFAAAWLAVAGAVSPALAQEPEPAQGQEIVVTGKVAEKDVVTEVVKIGDLNLATEVGLKEMEKRVTTAVDYICAIPAVVGYYKQKSEAPCRDEAWSSARPQMDNAVQWARLGSK